MAAYSSSADALEEDEWWLDPEEREASRTGEKRKDEEVTKNRKRRKISEVLKEAKPETHTALHTSNRQCNELVSSLRPVLEKLTDIETQSVQLTKKHFIPYKSDEMGVVHLGTYLTDVWDNSRWAGEYGDLTGAPLVIILTSSAERASELKRQVSGFSKNTETIKLCAKTSKFSDHVTYLAGHVTPIAVATPNRLHKLINDGHLRLVKLKLLLFDWYWRNKKLKRIHDIPEIWQDIVQLYLNHFNELVNTKQCKIGLL